MKQIFKLPKGSVKAYIKQGDSVKTVYDDHNTIVNNAKTILAHLLGGDNWFITEIVALKAATILATDSSLTVNYLSATEVEFIGKFSESSFNDTLDELQLYSAAGGLFARLTGLTIQKTDAQQLGVTWVIEFKDCI